MVKRKALGRGLSALIPDVEEEENIKPSGYFQCPVESIEPNPLQPRQDFEPEALEELAMSIKEKGIITPLLVSKSGEIYRLIAGERRWRAAQKAGLEKVPVIVRETTPIEALELALIENIQRKDLNPIEEATAYKKWLDDANTTQDILAKRVGKDRSTITNMLRLLNLPDKIQKDIVNGNLSMGHARVLAGIKNNETLGKLRDIIVNKGLSVRQAEDLLRKDPGKKAVKKENTDEDYYIQSLAEKLKRSLGTKVEIRRRGKKGLINIYFYTDDELTRLLDMLS